MHQVKATSACAIAMEPGIPQRGCSHDQGLLCTWPTELSQEGAPACTTKGLGLCGQGMPRSPARLRGAPGADSSSGSCGNPGPQDNSTGEGSTSALIEQHWCGPVLHMRGAGVLLCCLHR